MYKKIFVSFFLTTVLVFGVFAVAAPARAEASTLWGAAKEQLGANASTFSIISLVKSWAIRFSIAIPEWFIPGKYDSRTLDSVFLKSITNSGIASASSPITILSPQSGNTFSFSNIAVNLQIETEFSNVSAFYSLNEGPTTSCGTGTDTGIFWQFTCQFTLNEGLNTVNFSAVGGDVPPFGPMGTATWTGTYTPSTPTISFATGAQLFMDNVAISNLTSHEILLNGTRTFRVEPLPVGSQFASTDPTGVSSWRTGDFSFDTISIDPTSNSFSTTVTGESINTGVLLSDVKTCVVSDTGTRGVCPDGYVEQFLAFPFHTTQVFLQVVNQYTQPGPVYASGDNGIDVVPASQTIGIGQAYPLVANPLPSGSIFATPVSWSSANSSIASVDSVSGVVTGVATGTVRITATTMTCVVSNARANSNLATVIAGVASGCPPEYGQVIISDFSDIIVTSGGPSTSLSITNDAPYFCTTNQKLSLAVSAGADCNFGTIEGTSINLSGSVSGLDIASFTIQVVGSNDQNQLDNTFEITLNRLRFNEFIEFPFPGRYTITETLVNTGGESVVLVKHFNTDPRANDNITPTLVNKISLFSRDYPEGYELPVSCQVGGNIIENNLGAAILAFTVPTNNIICEYGTLPFDTNIVWNVSISDNIDNNIVFFSAELVSPFGTEEIITMETSDYPAFENQEFQNEITGMLVPGTSYEIRERLIDGNNNTVTITKKFKTATAISLSNTVTDASFSPSPVIPGTCESVEGGEVCNYPATSSTNLNILAEARFNNPGNQMGTITVTAVGPGGFPTRLICSASRQESEVEVDFISCPGFLSFITAPFTGQSGIYVVTEVATDENGNTYTVTKNFEFISPDNVKPQLFNRLSANNVLITPTCGTIPNDAAAALAFTVSCCPTNVPLTLNSTNTASATLAILQEPLTDCYYGTISTSNVTWGATVIDTDNRGQSSAISFFNAILIPPVGSGLPPVTLAGNPPIPNPTPTPYIASNVNLSPYLTQGGLWTIRENARDIYGNFATITKTFDIVLDNTPADIINTLTVGGVVVPGSCVTEGTPVTAAAAILAGVTKTVNCNYQAITQSGAVISLDINDNSRLLGSVLVYATAPGGLPVEIYNSNNINAASVILAAPAPLPGLTTPLHIDIPYLFDRSGPYLIEERVVDAAGNISILRKNIPYNPDTTPAVITNNLSINGVLSSVACSTSPLASFASAILAIAAPANSVTCDYGTTTLPNIVISGNVFDPAPIPGAGVGNLQLNRAFSVNNTAATALAIDTGLFVSQVNPTSVQGGISTNYFFQVVNPFNSAPLSCTIDAGDGRPLLELPLLPNISETAAILAISGTSYNGAFTLTYGVTGEPIVRDMIINCVNEFSFDEVYAGSSTTPITINPSAPTGGITYSGFNPTTVNVGQQSQYAVVISDSGANPPVLSCTVQTGDDTFYSSTPGGGLTILPTGDAWVVNYFHTYNTVSAYGVTITCNDSANNLFNQVGSFDVEVRSVFPPPPLPGGVRSFTITATAPGGSPVPLPVILTPTGSFSVPYILSVPGPYIFEEVAVDLAGNVSQVTKLLNYNPDNIPPALRNTLSVDGSVVEPVCTVPTLPPTPAAVALAAPLPPTPPLNCDYGTIYSSNVDWALSVNDNSGSISFLRADIFPPIPALPGNLASVLVPTPTVYSASTNLAPFLTTAGQYRIVESTRDAAGNVATLVKVWNYVPDTTAPEIINDRYNTEQIINPSVTLSGSVTDALPSAGLRSELSVNVVNADGSNFFRVPLNISPLTPNTGTFSFDVILTPGENTIIETICDNRGNCSSFTKTINFYPSRANVSVEQVETGSKRTDAALETKVFSAAAGSCATTIGTMPKNWDNIYNACVSENTKKETDSPVVGNAPRNLLTDLVGVGVGTGDKLVIVRSQQNVDGSYGYMGFQLPGMVAGETRNVGFERTPGQDAKGVFVQSSYFTKNSNGIWQSSRRAEVIQKSASAGIQTAQVIDSTVADGSLQVFTPEHITWANGTEIYPFLFISDGEWTLDVCLQVPAGYQIVAPGTCDQAFIANEAKVVEFKLAEGSSTAAALLSQAVGEPVFGVSLLSKASGSSVAQTSNYRVSGTRSSSKRASDAKLAPTIAKITADQAAEQKAKDAKIAAVIAQAEQAASGQAVSTIAMTFKLTLTAGSQGADVLRLQQYLNNKGFTVSASGPGSRGQESSYFGPKTRDALKRFQEAHRAEILTPLGLSIGTGLFGPSTRAYINAHQ